MYVLYAAVLSFIIIEITISISFKRSMESKWMEWNVAARADRVALTVAYKGLSFRLLLL
jgi:hypothetical protein